MKRAREDELAEEVESVKAEISALKAEKAEWKAKAEQAEREGEKAEAKEHLGRYDTVNTQLASLQQQLLLAKSALDDERRQKREKISAADFSSNLPGPVRAPSKASESALHGKLVVGSAAIHEMAFFALKCCVDDCEAEVNFKAGASDVLALLNRFGSNEDFGFFKGSVQVQEELAHTSWLTDLLHHHFPKSGDFFLHWAHQLPDPQAGRMDIALYVSSTVNGPVVPVAVIEVGFKGSSKQWQAAAYAVNISPQIRNGNSALLSVELSIGEPQEIPRISLRCYAAASSDEVRARDGQKFLWTTNVWQGDVRESDLARVLESLVGAAPLAFNSTGAAFHRVGANMCISHGQVMKFFDYRYRSVAKEQRRSSTLSLKWLGARLLEELKSEELEVVAYKFVEGAHYASTVLQLLDVAKQLKALHSADICHGDIRAYNMVFCNDGGSHLIDFDFAGDSGKRKYPKGYSHDINDAKRHEKAVADARLAKDHDSFALASVMEFHTCEDAAAAWKAVIELVRSNKLDNAIEKMQEIGDKKLKPSGALRNLSQEGTGSPPRK